MSDKLYPAKLKFLLEWILKEEKQETIFGIFKDLFFKPDTDDAFKLKRYDQLLETPIGTAAGPQTQMAQNILISYLMGARYIELKTIQTLDELNVTKPCIEIYDEGYNCEWSQELKIKESFNEYLNAWILIHVLKDKFNFLRINAEPGFIFNMSVGYDLKGILKPNVQWFLNKMQNCEEELQKKIKELEPIYPEIIELNIPSRISNNVTLSTMHGCPPEEIESIAEYLITERKLNTIIKLNPTLLGEAELNNILVNKLGYEIKVPSQAFEHDLKFDEAISMIPRLQEKAKKYNLKFGIKLTNTLETKNKTLSLPKNEKMVYMSGRALHPISINLAFKLQKEFKGELDISFSAGADAFNVTKILKCNLKPVTVCSDLLKPGGYLRLNQYLKNIRDEFSKAGANSIEDFVVKNSSSSSLNEASLKNLEDYSTEVLENERYQKNILIDFSIKSKRELTQFDCIKAPCVNACAISQDVPQYMYFTAREKFDKAIEVIYLKNPLPNITGNVCDHLCQSKCTRINIDAPLKIRAIKKFNAELGTKNFKFKTNPKVNKKVAIIGAGPAGLSAAYFLLRNGLNVTIFEKSNQSGGMVTSTIPRFRMERNKSNIDINNIKRLGAKFNFNFKITKNQFEKIRNEYDFVLIAVGAQKAKKLNIVGESLPNVFNQLEFLSKVSKGELNNLGNSVAVIGGGNSAMDAARTAKRIVGENGKVTLIYRRTVKEMPADREEIKALIDENIEIIEKSVPIEIEKSNSGLKLILSRVKLVKSENDSRPTPIKIKGSNYHLFFDSIITAVGQEVELDFLPKGNIVTEGKNKIVNLKNVFIGGDALRGADSLINAIADGLGVAESILHPTGGTKYPLTNKEKKNYSLFDFQMKISERKYPSVNVLSNSSNKLTFESVDVPLSKNEAVKEAERCLYCDEICNICVTVCPNLANVHFTASPVTIQVPVILVEKSRANVIKYETVSFKQENQIINLGDFCNECGNCATFCPTAGAPYKTKPRFFLSEKSWEEEGDGYFVTGNTIKYLSKNRKDLISLDVIDGKIFYRDKFIKLKLNSENFEVENIEVSNNFSGTLNLKKAAEMYYLLSNLKNQPFINNN